MLRLEVFCNLWRRRSTVGAILWLQEAERPPTGLLQSHPSIFFQSWRQQVSRKALTLFSQLLQGSQRVPRTERISNPSGQFWVGPRSPPSGMHLEYLQMEDTLPERLSSTAQLGHDTELKVFRSHLKPPDQSAAQKKS